MLLLYPFPNIDPICFMRLLHKSLELLGLKNQTVGIFGAKMMLGLKNEKSLLSSFLRLLVYMSPTIPHRTSGPHLLNACRLGIIWYFVYVFNDL